jgi:hypothetical protein
LDDDGQTKYNFGSTGKFVSKDVDIFLVAKGTGCDNGAPVTFKLYDTDDGSTAGGTPSGPLDILSAPMFQNKAVAKWVTPFSSSSPDTGDVSPVTSNTNIDYIFTAESVSFGNIITSNNYIVLSTESTCSTGGLGTANTNAQPFEACDVSAFGGFDYPQLAGAFYDNSNVQPGFTGGYRVCTGTPANQQCGISLKNSCKMDSATLTAQCGPDNICQQGETISFSVTNLRQTKSLIPNNYNCDFRSGFGHSLVFDPNGPCIAAPVGYDGTNIIGQAYNGLTISSPLEGPYYDLYESISGQWTVPATLPPGCSGQTITGGKIYAMTNGPNSVVPFASYPVSLSGSFSFPQGCSISTYFADAAGNQLQSGTGVASGGTVKIVLQSSSCSPSGSYSFDIYQTNDGVTPTGSVIDTITGTWSTASITQTWTVPSTAPQGTKYIFKFVNPSNGIDLVSSNYIQVTQVCSDGTAVGSCSAANPGMVCKEVSGTPVLLPNCFGQTSSPACACAPGGSCVSGLASAFKEDFTSATTSPTYLQNFGGSTATVLISGESVRSSPSSFKFIKNSGSSSSYSVYYFPLSVVSGKTYTAEVWVKTNRASFARFYVKPASSDFSESGAFTSPWHTGDNTWQLLSKTFTASSSSYNIMLEVKGVDGTAYFDVRNVGYDDYVCSTGGGCTLNSVSISPLCAAGAQGGTCGSGEQIQISAQYSGSCPSQVKIQVDASGETCSIQHSGGDISGMDILCTSSPCVGMWSLPTTIPSDCIAKSVTATSASIRKTDWTYLGDALSVLGSFPFIGAVSLGAVTASPTTVAQGTEITMTSTGASGDGTLYLVCGDTSGGSNLCSKTVGTATPLTQNPSCRFIAPWGGSGPQTIYCRALDDSTGIYSPEKTTQVTRDNTGFPVSFVNPPSNSWQKSDFVVTVSWVGASKCYLKVESGTLVTRDEQVSCATPYYTITVGQNKNCAEQGDGKCKITATTETSTGVRTSVSRTFSIDWLSPTGSASYTPTAIGNNTIFNLHVDGSDDESGLQRIAIYMNNVLKTEQASSPVVFSTKQAAGTVVNYYGIITDRANNTVQTAPASFTVCKLDSVVISGCADNACRQGDSVMVSAQYHGACPETSYIQIDAASSDSVCKIEASGADMTGIQLTCTSGVCVGQWVVPQVPSDCVGKTVNLKYAALYAVGFPPQPLVNKFDLITPVDSIFFAYPPGSCGSVANQTCDPVNRPLFCNNSLLINNAQRCGCPNGDFYTIGPNNNCVIASCGTTEFESCQYNSAGQLTGLYCTGTNVGDNVYVNVSLIPNTAFCTCPSGTQPVSKPWYTVSNESFETSLLPVVEHAGGSSALAGIYPPGRSGLYAYVIEKTNTQGSSRSLLQLAWLEIGERYTVSVYAKTNITSFAYIYDDETNAKSKKHSGSNSWEKLSYVFDAQSSTHTLAMEVFGKKGRVLFDDVLVQKHDYVCTPVCIDGTPQNECAGTGEGDELYCPYYCGSQYPFLSCNANACGCPEGMENINGQLCDVARCDDGTPHDQCSVQNQGYFCDSSLDELVLDEDQCGCIEGYGQDVDTGECIECTDALSQNPPTGGYARCQSTNGTLMSNITVSNETCNVNYNCVCPEGFIFDIGFGCVDTCNNNNICEPFESLSLCPIDCPVQWTNVRTNLTHNGVEFSGDLQISLKTSFRTCNGNATIARCLSVPYSSCGINSSCYCGSSFSTNCDVKCSDYNGIFYMLSEGMIIQGLNTRQVTIASPIQQFSCPVFNVPALRAHIQIFKNMQQESFEGLELALYQMARAETEEEQDSWEFWANTFRELLLVIEPHITYLQGVVDDPDLEKVTEAFALTEEKYDEIEGILAGRLTTPGISSVDFPAIVQVPQNQNKTIFINVSLNSAGEATRWVNTECEVQNPRGQKTKLRSPCIELETNTTETIIFNMSVGEYGEWPINYCSMNASTVSSCVPSILYTKKEHIGKINVTSLPLLQITGVKLPGSLNVGDLAVFEITVKNIDSIQQKGFVQCNVKNPSSTAHVIKSDNRTIEPGASIVFTPNRTVDIAGTWTVDSCTMFRIGSLINEGTFIINNNFDVGPADFSLTPETTGGSVGPGGTIEYEIVLKNLGISREIYNMTLSSENNWTGFFEINGNRRTSTQLNPQESANITVNMTHTVNATDETITTLTVRSFSGRQKQVTMITRMSIPNHPPQITLNQVREEIRKNTSVTFAANIEDDDNDTITARICIGTCNVTCPLAKNNDVFTCNYFVNFEENIYNYFVNATDSEAVVLSDKLQFSVVAEDFCRAASDCGDNYECRQNHCVRIVSCPGTRNECYVLPSGGGCGGCGIGFDCMGSTCQIAPECTADSDCSSGQVCDNFLCKLEFTGCSKDSDCGSGYTCVNRTCEPKTEDSSMLIIITIIIVIIAAFSLFMYIRRRWEEEEEYE